MKLKLSKIFAVDALLEGIWVYGMLVWGYISIQNLISPDIVYSQNLSVYIPIKENILVIAAFIVSLVAFIIWKSRLESKTSKR